MASDGGDLVRPSDGEEPDWFERVIPKCARSAVVRHRVADWQDDLAQELRVAMWNALNAAECVNLLWIRRKASSLARKEARRRKAESDRQRTLAGEEGDTRALAADQAEADSRVGIPLLCEGIARVAGRRHDRLILACALEVIDDVVDVGRNRAQRIAVFRAAYLRRWSVRAIAERFKKRPAAVTEQLRRLSRAVERHLAARLRLTDAMLRSRRTADRVRVVDDLESFLLQAQDSGEGIRGEEGDPQPSLRYGLGATPTRAFEQIRGVRRPHPTWSGDGRKLCESRYATESPSESPLQ